MTELERIWKKAVIVNFKVISQQLGGGTGVKYRKCPSRYQPSRVRFEPLNNDMWCSSILITHCIEFSVSESQAITGP